MSAARIGKIRMKAGGAEVRLISQASRDDNLRGVVIDHARRLADLSKPSSELVGFYSIGFYSDGSHSVGCRIDPKTCPVPRTLLPAFVAEIMRRDLVTAHTAQDIACDVVNRANGFDPDPAP